MSNKRSAQLPEELRAGIAAKLEILWKANKPLLLERTATLKASCDAWLCDRTDATAAATGLDAAHKLAGVLGTFGLQRGSEIASQIELILGHPETASGGESGTVRALVDELAALVAAKL